MILFRYLAKEIIVSMLAVTFTLLAIVMSVRMVNYLDDASNGDLAPEVLLSLIAYRIPSFLELVLPLGLFIGILLAYGRLYVESEMTVMRACGLSTRRLCFYTLIPACFVAILVGLTTMVASPFGIAKAQDILADAKNSSGLETLVSGRFRSDVKSNRVTYVEGLEGDKQTMRNVFISQTQVREDGTHERSVIFAEQGRIKIPSKNGRRYLVLDEGYRYLGNPGEVSFQLTQFDQFGLLVKEPTADFVYRKKPDARTMEELLASNRLEDQAALQWRISLVILVPIMALIAQALSKTDHRRGRYGKMLPAFIIYIIYTLMLEFARGGIEKEVIPVELGMWWIHAIFLGLALLLLFGANWFHQLHHRSKAAVS